jgi:DNA polymerase-3 subunit gamma/tau
VWPDVLEAVRIRKRTPHALLLNAQVTAVTPKGMTVTFNSAALARQFDQGVNIELLREALREVLGVDWPVMTAVAGTEPQLPAVEGAAGVHPPAFAPGDEPTPDSPREDDGKHDGERVSGEDAAMALLKSGLGAQVIGEVEEPG